MEAARATIAERAYDLLAPLAFGAVYLGARVGGADRDGLRQRRGFLPPVPPCGLWLHGASAGEMAAAGNLVALLRAHGHVFSAAYTAANPAGVGLIGRRLAPGDVCALVPWDVRRWVGRALDRWRPAALVLIETELWPGLIRAAAARRVAVLSASARIYPRDVWRYRVIGGVMAATLRRVQAVLAQSEVERGRFLALGAPPGACRVAGNLKHLAAPPPADAAAFRSAIGIGADRPLWTAGSVHADEVPFLCAALERLPPQIGPVVVAPRTPAALRALAAAAVARRWPMARRSNGVRPGWRLLALDTMGELRAAYAASSAAFVGGTVGDHGGHDLVEPVRCGAPVVFGPHTAHAEPDATALRTALPAAVVRSPAELAARVAAWSDDPGARDRALALQRTALPDPALIGDQYLEALVPWLGPDERPGTGDRGRNPAGLATNRAGAAPTERRPPGRTLGVLTRDW